MTYGALLLIAAGVIVFLYLMGVIPGPSLSLSERGGFGLAALAVVAIVVGIVLLAWRLS